MIKEIISKDRASSVPLSPTWIKKTCENCGNLFYIPRWREPQRFCSQKCANEVPLGGRIPRLVTKKCEYCGKEFTRTYWMAKSRKYCSQECAIKASRGRKGCPKPKGKLSPFYKGPILKHNGIWDYDEHGNFKPVHRMIVEKSIGRELRKNEIIHHIDGNQTNNNMSNLYLCSKAKHARLHQSIIKMLKPLMEDNKILFNKERGEYFLPGGTNG